MAERDRTADVTISTIDAFKGALRNASSIGYVADGHSGTVFLRTLDRIGLAEELKPKLKPLIGRPCAVAVPNREVGLCAAPTSTPAAGVEIVGRFPEEIQTYVVISAGLAAASESDAAKSLIKFLASPEAASVFKAKGYQLIPRR